MNNINKIVSNVNVEYPSYNNVNQHNTNTAINKVETVDVLSFATNNVKNSFIADNFFEQFGNGNYGVDQGITNKVYNEYKYINEAPRILDKLQKKYNFNYMDSHQIMTNMDSAGACTYAAFANEIFTHFANNEESFKNKFGFDMYIKLNDGTKILNSSELLIDLFISCNIGTLFQVSENNNLYISSKDSNNTIDLSKQRILDTPSIKEWYLNSKGLKYTQTSHITKNLLFSENDNEEINKLKDTLINEFNDGKSIILSANSGGNGINMYSENGYVNTNSFGVGGHAVFVTNVDQDKITVSSWGKKYYINYNELNDTRFDIEISNIS